MKKLVLAFLLIPIVSFGSSISLTMENDVFVVNDDSDYTHGTELRWMSDDNLWIFDNYGLLIQQNMYTPSNIDMDYNQPYDRPYCGYLGAGVILDNYFNLNRNLTITLRNEFILGTIGPSSGVEETQKFIHKLIGSRTPHWKYQLRDEFIAEYVGHLNFNFRLFKSNGFEGYAVPSCGTQLGLFKDSLYSGIDFVLGYRPRIEVGPDYLLSSTLSSSIFNNTRLYGIAGVNTYFIPYDITIDGYHKNNYPNYVKHEKSVSDVHAGVVLSLWDFDISYLVVYKTKEYDTQDNNNVYAKIGITYKW